MSRRREVVQTVDAGPYGSGPRPAWLDVDWRSLERRVRLFGREVNYVEAGEGPPMVFVHGHSASWQHWLEQLPHFMRSHRVVALDLPGFGRSEMPADETSISLYARTVDALCDHLGIDRAILVGSSMGGFVSAEVAIEFGTRVEGLVLVAAAGLAGRYVGVPTELIRHPSAAAVGRVLLAQTGAPARVQRAVVSRPRGRQLALGWVAPGARHLYPGIAYEIARGTGRPAAWTALAALAGYDFRDRVPDIACPTLIVWGDRDRLVPGHCADDYERLIPDARKVVYARTGHLPMVERPQRFTPDLERFAAEVAARGAKLRTAA